MNRNSEDSKDNSFGAQEQDNKLNEEQGNSGEETNAQSENERQEESGEEQKVNELQKKIDELNDKYLRLFSEFDNYRKRTLKEKIELSKSAGEDIFKSLLPVLDDFERAMKHMNESDNVDALKEGVTHIYKKLKAALVSKGLEEMKAKGEAFDADLHEAITNIPAPSDDMKGKVVDEAEKGYLLNGKVIRYAKVIVGN